MEFASFLAGERWSDHPRCTHPLLATMARLINDHTSDDGRQRLVALIPSVIGLTSNDPRWDVTIARRAATAALPVAAAHRQRALAVGVLVCRRIESRYGLPATAEHHEQDELDRAALALAPDARRWAAQFADDIDVSLKGFRRNGAASIVLTSVVGIAEACIPDPDDRLYGLLAATIDDCTALAPPDEQQQEQQQQQQQEQQPSQETPAATATR
jgi:hypothetical protein